jgi:endonuclease YncB( thermonuclease family)
MRDPTPLPARIPFTWWQIAAYTIGAILSVAFVVLQVVAVLAAPIDASDIRVIDGDTIRIHHQRPDVRLVGFNAPETRGARCEAEAELGARATRRLRDLVRAGNLDFQFVPCACRPGTEGTRACNYGRRCGTLKAGGRDVGAILIAEGLAAPFQCGPTRCPRTPSPWCG